LTQCRDPISRIPDGIEGFPNASIQDELVGERGFPPSFFGYLVGLFQVTAFRRIFLMAHALNKPKVIVKGAIWGTICGTVCAQGDGLLKV